MGESKPDVSGVAVFGLVVGLFALWMAVGGAIAMVRGAPISYALYIALAAAVGPFKLTLLFMRSGARNKTRMIVCLVLSVIVFAGGLAATKFLQPSASSPDSGRPTVTPIRP